MLSARASATARQITPKFRRNFSTTPAPAATQPAAAPVEAAAATTPTTPLPIEPPTATPITSSSSECRGRALLESCTKKVQANGGKNPCYVALCWAGLGAAYLFVNSDSSSVTDCIREYKYKFLTQRREAQAIQSAQAVANQNSGMGSARNQAEVEFFTKRNLELEKLRQQQQNH